MKKYKLLRFGRCYLNHDYTFAIIPLAGNKKTGYQFLASHANTFLWNIQTLSRVVPNDGTWHEIDYEFYDIIRHSHNLGIQTN